MLTNYVDGISNFTNHRVRNHNDTFVGIDLITKELYRLNWYTCEFIYLGNKADLNQSEN